MAAETLRICAAPGGSPVLDLAGPTVYIYAPGSLHIDPDCSHGQSDTDWEGGPSGTISWSQIIMGGAAGTAVDALIAEIERADPPGSRFVEWRPADYADSRWFERRGPGTWAVTERWHTRSITVIACSLPVAPTAYGAPLIVAPAAQTLPAVFDVPDVPGTLWAALDVSMAVPAVRSRLAWALMAPYQGDYGIREGETTIARSPNWTGVVAATGARGGEALWVSPVVPSTDYEASWYFQNATLNVDEMEQDLGLEVWIRLAYDPTLLVAPTMALRAKPQGAGADRHSIDFGQSGRQFGNASSAAWFLHRAGLIKLTPDCPIWLVTVSLRTAPVASGNLSVDYALFAPGRWRACSPTGIPNDSAYPVFMPDGRALTKVIHHDLSGSVALSSNNLHGDTGLGGSPLYLPPGHSSILLDVSPAVPDDTSTLAGGDALGPTVAPVLTVTPRYRLLDARSPSRQASWPLQSGPDRESRVPVPEVDPITAHQRHSRENLGLVLANVLPGVRDLRAPLAAGYLWLLAAYLALGPSLPTRRHATGIWRSLLDLQDVISAVGVGAAVTFLAYLVGSIATVIASIVRAPLDTWRGNRVSASTYPFGPYSIGSKGRVAIKEVVERRVGVLEDALGSERSSIAELVSEYAAHRDPDRFPAALKAIFPMLDAYGNRGVEVEVFGEIDLMRAQLLGREPELFSAVDRQHSEAELRNAVAGALLGLGIALWWRATWWSGLLTIAGGVLLAFQGRQLARAGNDTLLEALRIGRVQAPTLERIDAAVDWVRARPQGLSIAAMAKLKRESDVARQAQTQGLETPPSATQSGEGGVLS